MEGEQKLLAQQLVRMSMVLGLAAGLVQCKTDQKSSEQNMIITPGGKTIDAEEADKRISTVICQRMIDCASKRAGKPAPDDAVSRCMKATKVNFDPAKTSNVKIPEDRVGKCVAAAKTIDCKEILSRSKKPPQACLQVTNILGALKKD